METGEPWEEAWGGKEEDWVPGREEEGRRGEEEGRREEEEVEQSLYVWNVPLLLPSVRFVLLSLLEPIFPLDLDRTICNMEPYIITC